MYRAIAAQMHLPNCFVSVALWYLKNEVVTHANFNIQAVSPIATQIGCIVFHSFGTIRFCEIIGLKIHEKGIAILTPSFKCRCRDIDFVRLS
jgi:hypothetical protein